MENCERYICIYLGGNAYGLSAKNGRVKKSFAMLNEENETDPLKCQLLLPHSVLPGLFSGQPPQNWKQLVSTIFHLRFVLRNLPENPSGAFWMLWEGN